MAFANRKLSRIFAGVFVCLFVLQAVAFFYHGLAHDSQPRPDAVADVSLTAKNEALILCDNAAGGAHSGHGECSHIGFCVLCSAEGRLAAWFVLPPLRVDYVVALRDDHEAPTIPASEPDVIPSPMTGWIASWSATSPPKA